MKDEALKLALYALKLGDTVFYPQTSIAIAAIEAALAQGEQSMVSYERFMSVEKELADMTAEFMSVAKQLAQPAQEPIGKAHLMQEGFTHCIWAEAAVPVDTKLYTTPQQRTEERNFCSRCGKRTADLTVIHTCTPPQENT
jgi:hypothetical protein